MPLTNKCPFMHIRPEPNAPATHEVELKIHLVI